MELIHDSFFGGEIRSRGGTFPFKRYVEVLSSSEIEQARIQSSEESIFVAIFTPWKLRRMTKSAMNKKPGKFVKALLREDELTAAYIGWEQFNSLRWLTIRWSHLPVWMRMQITLEAWAIYNCAVLSNINKHK